MPTDDLYLVHGDEPFLVDREVRRWREARIADGCEVETLDAVTKLAPLRASVLDIPLFAERRAVILRDPPQLAGREKKGADSATELADLIAMRPDETALCLVSHAVIAPANPVLAAVKAAGGQTKELRRLKGRDLRAWMDDEITPRQLKLPRGAVEHLLAVSGGELGAIASELDKIEAYAEGKPITLDDVRLLASGSEQTEMWAVMDRLTSDAPGGAAAAVDSLLAAGRAPQYLLVTLASQIREARLARALIEEHKASTDTIAKTMGLPSWRAERLVRQSRRIPGAAAEQWLHQLHRLDAQGKRGEADDAEGLRIFIRRAVADLVVTPS